MKGLPRALLLLTWLLSSGCSHERERLARELTGGDVMRGKSAFRRYGCGNCHEIHGAFSAQGHAGPAFHDFAFQLYLPGGLTNNPQSLVEWLRHPRRVQPSTAMPDLNVSERDAVDMAAYLYSLD